MPSNSLRKGRAPAEMRNIGATAAAILAVVAAGAGLASVLPDPSPWLKAAAFLAPASLAFACYWWAAQKL
jgi:hypothetical protein